MRGVVIRIVATFWNIWTYNEHNNETGLLGCLTTVLTAEDLQRLISCTSCINRMKTEKYYIVVLSKMNTNAVFLIMIIRQWSFSK
jgi:hypothetical protein